jgi:endonuclease YncB( thermonuclease family)
LYDAQINVQAFFANVYGSVDNLAWVWVHERGLKTIPRNRVGLRVQNTEVRATLSTAFQDYLKSRDEWFEHVIEYRDALAHRILLYIPPGGVPTRNVEAYNSLTRAMNDALYVLGDPYEYERLSAEQDQLLIFQPMITVVDGDTIEIHGTRVRLWGIDAPESDQLCRGDDSELYRCGQKAAAALAGILYAIPRPVICNPKDRDRYDRTVAICKIGDPGPDIAHWMVSNGHALD